MDGESVQPPVRRHRDRCSRPFGDTVQVTGVVAGSGCVRLGQVVVKVSSQPKYSIRVGWSDFVNHQVQESVLVLQRWLADLIVALRVPHRPYI